MTCNLLFTGDIMAQIAQNDACRTPDGYDYSPVLAPVRELLKAGDMTVGNLETPFAGEPAGYSFARYSFNTPEEMAVQIKDDGFDLVSLANNHCMDRNLAGLHHTLEVLDRIGLKHTGLARTRLERDTPCIVERCGMRFGFLSYTYGTNAFAHRMFLPESARYAVNLMQPEETLPGAIDLLDRKAVPHRVKELYETQNPLYEARIKPRLEQVQSDILRLRDEKADAVVMLLHCGGQHDPEPDAYTREVVKRIVSMGVDAVICNHQHILHPFSYVDGVPVAWCLGNLIQTPAQNVYPGLGPSYSAILRLCVEKTQRLYIRGVYARLTRCIEDERGRTIVYPLDRLIRESRGEDRAALISARKHYVNLLRGLPADSPVEETDEYRIG